MTMSDITLDDIDAAEGAIKNIRTKLQAIGRTLYQMREGKELGSEYGFDRYRRQNYEGPHYYEQEGPNWGEGTPIISLTYYWSRGETTIVVTLPQGWLERDWVSLETERLAAERAAAKQAQEADERAYAERQAIAERDTYERLRAKFEDTSHDHE